MEALGIARIALSEVQETLEIAQYQWLRDVSWLIRLDTGREAELSDRRCYRSTAWGGTEWQIVQRRLWMRRRNDILSAPLGGNLL